MTQVYMKCPVCNKNIWAYTTWVGWAHKDGWCWWTYGVLRERKNLTLWQRIKKHGLKARIF